MLCRSVDMPVKTAFQSLWDALNEFIRITVTNIPNRLGHLQSKSHNGCELSKLRHRAGGWRCVWFIQMRERILIFEEVFPYLFSLSKQTDICLMSRGWDMHIQAQFDLAMYTPPTWSVLIFSFFSTRYDHRRVIWQTHCDYYYWFWTFGSTKSTSACKNPASPSLLSRCPSWSSTHFLKHSYIFSSLLLHVSSLP